MYLLDLGILIVLVIVVILILTLLLRGHPGDVSARLDASLKEQFLAFQSGIHRELNSTREEVVRSKDLISEHTVKTIDTIKDMGATIHRIIQQQEDAQKLGQSLKDILQTPKLRGSPNTFYAFLQVIILGVRNIEIIKNVKKLQDGLTSIQNSFEKFYRKYEEMGKHLEKAHDAYRVGNSHIELYKHRLDSALKLEEFQENVGLLTKDGD